MNSLIIVDDEFYIRKMLMQSIPWNEIGYEVIGEAEDGISALKLIDELKPDAALVDINMPQMSGLELIENIVKSNPYISMVILTAYDQFSYAKEAIRLNVFDYLLKPIDPDEIQEVFLRMKSQIEKNREERARQENQTQGADRSGESLVESIRRDILTEYGNPDFSIKMLSQKYHMNQNHMCTVFKKSTGNTIMEELIERRMQIAQMLILENPGMSFSEIARAVGYGDPLYFSKAFKKKTGISPRSFRNGKTE